MHLCPTRVVCLGYLMMVSLTLYYYSWSKPLCLSKSICSVNLKSRKICFVAKHFRFHILWRFCFCLSEMHKIK